MKKLFLLIWPLILMSCSSDDGGGGVEENAGTLLDAVLERSFNGIVKVPRDSKTYAHLLKLSEEAMYQAEGKSKFGLPLLYDERNFPTVYNYYEGGETDRTPRDKTMIGWLAAMQLSELYPTKRNDLYKAGYEAGGYTMTSNMYGYRFDTDPCVARLVASAIYATMHTTANPDIEAMRREVGGTQYAATLEEILDEESRVHVTDDAFYVDLRKFMASAPGPIAPPYADRRNINPPIPDEANHRGCPLIDIDIYDRVTDKYNLPEQRAVQAIADLDDDLHHILGTDKTDVGGQYHFNAVFGKATIGTTISPEGRIAAFIGLAQKAGRSGRGILQHATPEVGHYEYGRLRPGCTERMQGERKSYKDDRLNVLTSFVIEDNDGHKASYEVGDDEIYYLDENGQWTHPDVQSAEQYEDMSKDLLYANSYPSGHASGIWSAAMSLMELYPQKADLIMRAANDFALSRVVSRYHWNSDIIQGRLVGSVMNPVCHAASDYRALLDAARAER